MRRPLHRLISPLLGFLAIFSIPAAALAGDAGNAAAGEPAAESRRPNIIFILADDLGWADLGCYGQKFFETPNLDRLAAEGVHFTSGYTASCVCSPTRSSVMTGKYPARNDLTIWLGGRGGAPAVDHLSLEEVTVAEALKEGGYATAHIGKWHLGGEPYFPETIVVFFSDNGGFSHSRGKKNNVTCNEPLRLGKGYCYEGGHRVPAIVRYPPVTGWGGVCDAPIITTDFYPTFLELAGLPPRPQQHADGVSIVPLLADPKEGDPAGKRAGSPCLLAHPVRP